MNKQKLALFIVLILLVLAVIWSFSSFPRLKTAGPQKREPGQARLSERKVSIPAAKPAAIAAKPAATSKVSSDERTLRLDLLESEQSGFKGYRRNIFRPIFADEIKLMKQKAVAIKPLPLPPVAVVVPKPPPVQPVAPPETLQSTLANFTFLGFLKKDNRKTIFLSKDKEIVLVRKGDNFAKRYQAIAITEQALTIRVTDTGEEIVIPLSENRPLSAAARK